METTPITTAEASCDFSCQFEWIEVSSNFFNISFYTPSLIAGIIGYAIYRTVKKARNK